jgi:uncharacterized protein YjbI with pentapeptide repeats
MESKKVSVQPHTRKGDVAVVGHDRTIETKGTTGGAVPRDETGAIRDGLQGLAEEDVPHGWKMVAGVALPCINSVPDMDEHPDLSGVSFAGRDLTDVNFNSLYLVGVDFTGANLTGATMRSCQLDGAIFKDANLTQTQLQHSEGHHVVFDGAVMNETDLSYSTLLELSADGLRFEGSPSDFGHAEFEVNARTKIPGLENAYFLGTKLSGIDWTGADLTDNRLTGVSHLYDSVLDDADMSEQILSFLEIENVSMRRVNARRTDFVGITLTGVQGQGGNFSEALFSDAYVRHSDFDGANFQRSRSDSAGFVDTSCNDCDFTGAMLTNSYVENARFRNVNFTDADLRYTNFATFSVRDPGDYPSPQHGVVEIVTTDLTGVTWTGANLQNTVFVRQYPPGAVDADVFTRSWTTNGGREYECWFRANYDKFTAEQTADMLGVSVDELGVLVWAEMLEVRDNKTGVIVTDNYHLNNLHVPKWALDNWK